jgi:HEAT repeat protein
VVVRAAAIRAIGEIGDPVSLERVLAAQGAEPAEGGEAVVACALVAAAKLGGPRGFRKSLALAEGRLEDSWLLRATAAHAAGVAGDRERVPDLLAALDGDADARVCQAAAAALADLGAREELAARLDHATGFRRRAAVAGFARLAGPDVRAALVRAARDEDPAVVLVAGSALLARGEAEAFPLLIGLLEADAPVWMGAMDALETRTGLAFGRNPPRWREWFDSTRERLRFREATGTWEVVR